MKLGFGQFLVKFGKNGLMISGLILSWCGFFSICVIILFFIVINLIIFIPHFFHIVFFIIRSYFVVVESLSSIFSIRYLLLIINPISIFAIYLFTIIIVSCSDDCICDGFENQSGLICRSLRMSARSPCGTKLALQGGSTSGSGDGNRG